MTVTVVHAEALAWLKTQPDCSFDAFFADPPYGLSPDGRARNWDDIEALRDGKERKGFMGKAWDAGVPGPTFWLEVLRVLKPGAPILAFGGTRTYHRLVCAMEDAGAEPCDTLMYLFGMGFPKSYNISIGIDAKAGAVREIVGKSERHNSFRAGTGASTGHGIGIPDLTAPATPDAERWNGYGTALRPAFEPCVLACKPFEGTIVANALKWGVGGLWIDGCRLPRGSSLAMAGGWPPNVMLDEEAALALDEASGVRTSGMKVGGKYARETGVHAGGQRSDGVACYADSGGASRFFYCAKVSRWERDFGCEALPLRTPGEAVDRETGAPGTVHGRSGAGGSGDGIRNHHPTLKAIDLTRWLATLILPPPRPDGAPRRLLNGFAGSGSEAIGAMRAGWDEVVSIEREAEYIPALEARVRRWRDVPLDMTTAEARDAAEAVNPRQGGLFEHTERET